MSSSTVTVNARTVQLVQDSWAIVLKIENVTDVVGTILFKNFFDLQPDAIRMFTFGRSFETHLDDRMFKSRHFRNHAKKVVGMLNTAVEFLGPDLQALEEALRQLGAKHIGHGILPEHYPLVGKALLKALATALADDFTRELEAAWSGVYGFVTQCMLDGANESLLRVTFPVYGDPQKVITLDEYIGSMLPGQRHLFYTTASVTAETMSFGKMDKMQMAKELQKAGVTILHIARNKQDLYVTNLAKYMGRKMIDVEGPDVDLGFLGASKIRNMTCDLQHLKDMAAEDHENRSFSNSNMSIKSSKSNNNSAGRRGSRGPRGGRRASEQLHDVLREFEKEDHDLNQSKGSCTQLLETVPDGDELQESHANNDSHQDNDDDDDDDTERELEQIQAELAAEENDNDGEVSDDDTYADVQVSDDDDSCFSDDPNDSGASAFDEVEDEEDDDNQDDDGSEAINEEGGDDATSVESGPNAKRSSSPTPSRSPTRSPSRSVRDNDPTEHDEAAIPPAEVPPPPSPKSVASGRMTIVNSSLSDEQAKEFCDWFQYEVGPDRVLKCTPTCKFMSQAATAKRIVAPSGSNRSLGAHYRTTEDVSIDDDDAPRQLEEDFKVSVVSQKAREFHVEINPNHRLVVEIAKTRLHNPTIAALLAEQIFDNCLVMAGMLDDPRAMVTRQNDLVLSLLQEKNQSAEAAAASSVQYEAEC